MQSKLLAKVEELTLHMIQQDKENRDLREHMTQQEKENKELRERLAQLETRAASSSASGQVNSVLASSDQTHAGGCLFTPAEKLTAKLGGRTE
jgi:phage shock protein A